MRIVPIETGGKVLGWLAVVSVAGEPRVAYSAVPGAEKWTPVRLHWEPGLDLLLPDMKWTEPSAPGSPSVETVEGIDSALYHTIRAMEFRGEVIGWLLTVMFPGGQQVGYAANPGDESWTSLTKFGWGGSRTDRTADGVPGETGEGSAGGQSR